MIDATKSKQRIQDCKHTIRYRTGIDIAFGGYSVFCNHPKVPDEKCWCLTCEYFEKREK